MFRKSICNSCLRLNILQTIETGQCISESGSAVSFKALQTRIEGVPIVSQASLSPRIQTVPPSTHSFENPLFSKPTVSEGNQSPTKEKDLRANLEPSFLIPMSKTSSVGSMKSIKSSKSFKSLLGLNKESVVENPMIDVSVDIGMEASKSDVFDFLSQDEVQNHQTSSNVDTEGKFHTPFKSYDLLI